MKPHDGFFGRDMRFWAYVRAVSETVGYTKRGSNLVRAPHETDINDALIRRRLDGPRSPDPALISDLDSYFQYRANILNSEIQFLLMTAREAEELFEEQPAILDPSCPLPMNKQKGEKKKPAFLTGLVNMLVEAHSGGLPCDYDPRSLITITRDSSLLRTFTRRVDGAFPSTVNPKAIWEIKEHYFTTTFGSRVAAGIYETLLDGMELEELSRNEGVKVRNYLIIDGHYTWWDCGRSYLCRLIDMLNMGFVDEVLFGREVIYEMPKIIREWREDFLND